MRALHVALVMAALVIAAGSCKRKAAPAKRDASAIEVDWFECEAALKNAPRVSELTRIDMILNGCHVCGDWLPLLDWGKLQTEGGPTRLAIEGAMLACKGYCDPNAKQRFLGTLDNARGADVRTPWRWLGEMCKAEVSAVPDTRYMSAPYFALDRVARAVAAHGGEPANLLAKIDLALPAVTMTGIGPALPIFDTGGRVSAAPRHHITVIAEDIYVGDLPRAHLDGSGVHVDSGPEPYPGHTVRLEQLATAWSSEPSPKIAVLMSRATPAQKLVELIAATGSKAQLFLAVDTGGGPEGWVLPSIIPVQLVDGAPEVERDSGRWRAAPDAIKIRPETTIEQLADELANHHAERVALIAI